MNRHRLSLFSIFTITCIFFTSASWAASIYPVNNAASDPVYHGGGHFHALWMPGLDPSLGTSSDAKDFIFQTPGAFTTTGSTALLTGTVVSKLDANRGWNLNINFSGLTSIAPAGSPKKELKSIAYSENGGPVNTGTWQYYTDFSGTLTGTGLYDGALISLTRFGPSFQMGEGANGKNILLGGSGWFSWTVTQQPTQGPTLNSRFNHGDFNLNFGTPQTTATPEPSTIILLGSGLAGVFAWKRRKPS